MKQQTTFPTIADAIGKPIICRLKKLEQKELTYQEQKDGLSPKVLETKEVTILLTADVMNQDWHFWKGYYVNLVSIGRLLQPHMEYGYKYYYSIVD